MIFSVAINGSSAIMCFSMTFRIYRQAIYDIQAQIQNSVDCKEAFRNGKTLVCRIIQRTLKPLCMRM